MWLQCAVSILNWFALNGTSLLFWKSDEYYLKKYQTVHNLCIGSLTRNVNTISTNVFGSYCQPTVHKEKKHQFNYKRRLICMNVK